LDIGVGGSGYAVIEGARRGCKSVGVDLSLEGIKKARYFATTELGEKSNLCGFIVSLAENLPFKDSTFTKISSIAVLEHVPDDKQAIAEIARVTKSGGKVFITVPNAYRRILPIFWLPYYFWDKRIGHLRHYETENLKAKFLRYGFSTSEVLYSGHLCKVLQILFSWIFSNFKKKDSKLWWKLEEMDLKNNSPAGVQLTLIMRKVK
jgi:ubiquinone/menaquinone biosynthesis C-methylase UbiE